MWSSQAPKKIKSVWKKKHFLRATDCLWKFRGVNKATRKIEKHEHTLSISEKVNSEKVNTHYL